MGDAELAGLVALAADEPRKAKAGVTKLARPLPARELAPFFESACREFAAADEKELATWSFTQARNADKNHPALVDMDRLHEVFLEFTPMGVVAPTALRDLVKLMGERLAPDEAYDRYREILDAAFAEGLVPYARIYPDVRTLAKAAKVKKDAAEDDLTGRLLRSGALRYASYAVWKAAEPSLARLARGDDAFLRLLIAAEPDADAEEDPEYAEEIRQMWLAALAGAGAGAHLTEEWFVQHAARCESSVMVRLVRQAGERLSADQRVKIDPDTELVFVPSPVPGASGPLYLDEEPPHWWERDLDTNELAEEAARNPERFAQRLDAFVRDLGRFSNVDYVATLRRLWEIEAFRDVLHDRVRTWKAEAASMSLPVLSHAVHRLLRLVDHGYADLDRGFTEGLEVTDPVDALRAVLRGGVPEELYSPHRQPGLPGDEVRVVQHGEHLTVTARSMWAQVWTPDRALPQTSFLKADRTLVFWHDGEEILASLEAGGAPLTLRAEAAERTTLLSLDPAVLSRRPDGSAEAAVVFPGAAEPSRVTYRRGVVSVVAPDGTLTARLRYAPRQSLSKEKRNPVYPPGWWPWLRAVDPYGSAALRDLDRKSAVRLVEMGLVGRGAVLDALPSLLPDVVEQALRDGVAAHARAAADCVLNAVRLRERLGFAQPSSMPSSLWTRPDLPAGGAVPNLPGLRWMEGVIKDAMEVPAASEPHQVRVVPLPDLRSWLPWQFGRMGGTALSAVWPWRTDRDRRDALETLNAWANTARGDGSGRWRLLRFTPEDGWGNENSCGQLWRTPRGVFLVGHYDSPDKTLGVWEYAPDGEFGPVELPGWREHERPVVPQGWGGADRVVALRRLLAERGPLDPDPAWAHELAERTGMSTLDAASIVFGVRYYDLHGTRLPAEIAAFYPEGGRYGVPLPVQDAVREFLMPDDPADLWDHGPDIARAARRYLELRT